MEQKEKLNSLDHVVHFCLHNKLVVFILILMLCAIGVLVAPFDWKIPGVLRSPVPVDAIPDIGENQQIIFTEWKGRSPQDVEDQVTYPLTSALNGIPGVKTVRSYSYFGFSSIYVIFEEKVEFYWSRSRIIEKLNSLSPGTLPDGVQARLGPDATALGQVFWYTLEGQDKEGNTTGGWDLDELRSIQDWQVRYHLMATKGVAEVASVGGFVKEYQIDVNPDAMRAHRVNIQEVIQAVRKSNIDVGARSIELNGAEYIIRGLGFIKNIKDIQQTVIKSNEHVPITINQIADVSAGPALRRGALDKEGAEAVGGVVVVRYGENPMQVIQDLKERIEKLSASLPKKTLADGRVSQVKIVEFYDRTGLIQETLGTLRTAISEEILVTMIVILFMVMHLRSAMLISGILPLTVLITFILMKIFGVSANIVALSGIAIAIGTIVDMAIVVCENILRHLEKAEASEKSVDVVFKACREVSGAVFTAVATTVVSFLPVFALEAAEGKLFRPLAYTKTFALLVSIAITFTLIPPLAQWLFTLKGRQSQRIHFFYGMLGVAGIVLMLNSWLWLGLIVLLFALYHITIEQFSKEFKAKFTYLPICLMILFVMKILSEHWSPLGPEKGFILNYLFVFLCFSFVLGFFAAFEKAYPKILWFCLNFKAVFLLIPFFISCLGLLIWLGVPSLVKPMPDAVKRSDAVQVLANYFPGLAKEFMPSLDEGSYLYMPTTMPHASIGETMDVMRKIDMAIASIPEVESVVGKLGRAETPLDPAPVSMIETIINYVPEYRVDKNGRRLLFKFDTNENAFIRDDKGELVPDKNGSPFRQWREHIRSEQQIWDEIVKVSQIPGTTSAPKLQPIAARLVMLQSGIRAPMAIKLKGHNLKELEKFGLVLEKLLLDVPGVEKSAVFAERIIGKPYLEIDIKREAVARYGIKVQGLQNVLETAVGGKRITSSVEGRKRYPIRIRYQRERRDSIEELKNILIPSSTQAQIPLGQLADIRYVRGPMVIKSEDSFLVSYVLFDKKAGYSDVDVVESCERYLDRLKNDGKLVVPTGIDYIPTGSYKQQQRAEERFALILPFSLLIIFLILYLQFKSVRMSLLVFTGIFVAWSGGFQLLWLYSQDWFMNFSLFDVNMRDLFNIHPTFLSVAVWVGFLALFGIATDDGVIMLTYIKEMFKLKNPKSIEEIREATVEAGKKRIRACLMTVATTIIALLPVLTSTGRGSDVMVPMAIPTFGGMIVALITVLVVPTLNCFFEERKFRKETRSR